MSNLSIINDEISDNLVDCVDFTKKAGINQLDLRSINKINLLDVDNNELEKAALYLKNNDIKVGMIVSPLFKWHISSNSIRNNFVTNFDLHHFNPKISQAIKSKYIEKAIDVAEIFSCDKIRIFSLIRDIETDLNFYSNEHQLYEKLITSANKHNLSIYLENEPMCNMATLQDIEYIYGDSNMYKGVRMLIDIGSIYYTRKEIDLSLLLKLIENSSYIHLKDYSFVSNSYVTIGEGNIPYKEIFSSISNINQKSFVFETHTSQNLTEITKSINYIKSILTN